MYWLCASVGSLSSRRCNCVLREFTSVCTHTAPTGCWTVQRPSGFANDNVLFLWFLVSSGSSRVRSIFNKLYSPPPHDATVYNLLLGMKKLLLNLIWVIRYHYICVRNSFNTLEQINWFVWNFVRRPCHRETRNFCLSLFCSIIACFWRYSPLSGPGPPHSRGS